MKRTMLSLLCIIAFTVSMCAGAIAAVADDLAPVTLIWYALGDPYQDHDEMMAELNALLKERINTTIEYKFTTWTDYRSKYNLLLSSGEAIDGILTAQWENFYNFANDGAFLDITDLVPEYCPNLYAEITPDEWKTASVNGRIYGVPQNVTSFDLDGWMYRDDWRVEFGIENPLTTLEDIEAYFDACIENGINPPMTGNCGSAIERLMQAYIGYEEIAGDDQIIVRVRDYFSPTEIIAYPFLDEYLEFAQMLKRWADKGYWRPDAIADPVDTREGFGFGTGAIHWANIGGANNMGINWANTADDGRVLGYMNFRNFTGCAYKTIANVTGMAIPRSSKNPERSLMAMDSIRSNQDSYDLIVYGIEGKNWSLAEDGQSVYRPAQGTDNAVVDWANWNFPTLSLNRPRAEKWSGYDEVIEYYETMLVPNIYTSLALDYDEVQNEVAAVSNVVSEYRTLILYGMGDPDQLVAEYRQKLTDAGIEKVVECVRVQMLAYYESNNITVPERP
ncbi:MAG: extracellular solute-binding protein [Clostridia bacterium]|nr:extracellular solute-binding protein [Clostridia bacterium]